MTTIAQTTGLMNELHELWDGEGLEVHIGFDEPYFASEEPWHVTLEWTTESGNPHQADWARYTWQFYGETPEESITAAIDWARSLLPFEQCHTCDGRGFYHYRSLPHSCDTCDGTGLAHPELSQRHETVSGADT